jgi:hypothetical protein
VFEFDESVARAFRNKADFNLAGFGHVAVERPVGRVVSRADVPGKADSVGRIPLEDRAPVALNAFNVALVPAAANSWLDKDCFKGCFADVVGVGPPGLHLLNEDREGALDGRYDTNALKHF